MAIKNVVLTSTPEVVFAAPPDGECVVTPIYICNYSGATVNVNIYLVNNSTGVGTVGNGTIIYKDLQISDGDTYVIDREKLVLSNNGTADFIAASVSGHPAASGNTTMTISYSRI